MLGAEVEHLLGLGDAADVGAGEHLAAADQRAEAQRLLLRREADDGHDAARGEQAQVAVHGDVGADRVEDQVEPAAVVAEEVLVGGRQDPRRAEGEGVLLLAQRAGEDGDLGAHRRGDLDAHVAEPAEAEDRHALGAAGDLLAGAPAAQRGVGGDAGAQQRGGLVEGDLVRDPQHEALVDDDLLRVAALGDGAVDVLRVVGADVALEAVLLLVGEALLAGPAGVHEAAHTHAVADLPVGDVAADGGDGAGDLVPDGEGEVRLAPLVADGVDVAVADAGGLDVDDHVVRTGVAALDRGDAERLVRAGLLQGLDGDRHGGGAPPWRAGRARSRRRPA